MVLCACPSVGQLSNEVNFSWKKNSVKQAYSMPETHVTYGSYVHPFEIFFFFPRVMI